MEVTTEKRKIVVLKEEQNSLQWVKIISRKKSDLNLQNCILKYEFSLVSVALFAVTGPMLLEKQKYNVASMILDIVEGESILTLNFKCQRLRL